MIRIRLVVEGLTGTEPVVAEFTQGTHDAYHRPFIEARDWLSLAQRVADPTVDDVQLAPRPKAEPPRIVPSV